MNRVITIVILLFGYLSWGITADKCPNLFFACFGDLDASPTKAWMVENREDAKYQAQYEFGFGRRAERELYVLADDSDQVGNRSGDPSLAEVEAVLHRRLMNELKGALDPRATQDPVPYESAPFTD
tara:strand:- start:506 stop:883 length:378 start_codon:yes stop_codon:yes gene_type:complete